MNAPKGMVAKMCNKRSLSLKVLVCIFRNLLASENRKLEAGRSLEERLAIALNSFSKQESSQLWNIEVKLLKLVEAKEREQVFHFYL